MTKLYKLTDYLGRTRAGKELTWKIPVPTLTAEQQVKFAIFVKTVCKDTAWNAWADKWLNGEDQLGGSGMDSKDGEGGGGQPKSNSNSRTALT